MNTKSIVVLLTAAFLTSCGTRNENTLESGMTAQEKEEIQSLKEQGYIGMWKCNAAGYESIISLKEKNKGQFYSIIEFENEKMESISQELVKQGEKYTVAESRSNEHYVVNEDGDLELWDSGGMFTIALNITPGQETELPGFTAEESIGENVFFIARTYSKSIPETLTGSNNQYWIVYYEDLDVSFKVVKSTDVIINAKPGRHPNF